MQASSSALRRSTRSQRLRQSASEAPRSSAPPAARRLGCFAELPPSVPASTSPHEETPAKKRRAEEEKERRREGERRGEEEKRGEKLRESYRAVARARPAPAAVPSADSPRRRFRLITMGLRRTRTRRAEAPYCVTQSPMSSFCPCSVLPRFSGQGFAIGRSHPPLLPPSLRLRAEATERQAHATPTTPKPAKLASGFC